MVESMNQMPGDIGDRNTEQLLAKAYRPEVPDAAFAQQVKEAMLARRTPPPHRFPAWRTVRPILTGVAAMAVVTIGLFGLLRNPDKTTSSNFRRDGNSIWIGDKEYKLTDAEVAVAKEKAGLGMTPRKVDAPPAAPTVAIGERIATGPNQRRRITLGDGSILYVNQNTALTIDAARRVSLTSGEVYVQVSPREATASLRDPTFLVKTPTRQVAAMGTHFAVDVGDTGTGVVVTQGTVNVGGISVKSGQQLPPDNGVVSEAPRSSVVLDWIQDLVKASETPLVPASEYGGGSLVAIDPNGQDAKLTLRNFTVDVYIEDGFARTTIDQTYFNHLYSRLEGTFYFPLPPDASLSRLAMYVEGDLMEGGMCEREYAREVFETILHTRRDPALLEWVDGSTFKMRVFPLEGRQEKRIILSYTQKLDSLYGRTQFRFPAGHTMAMVRDWSFRAHIKDGAATPWASESHGLLASRDGRDLILSASARDIKPDRDVTLNLGMLSPGQKSPAPRFNAMNFDEVLPGTAGLTYKIQQGDILGTIASKLGTTVSAIVTANPGLDANRLQINQEIRIPLQAASTPVNGRGSRYFMLRHVPTLASEMRRQRRDWVFLFESSGARDPLLARAQVDVVKAMLENAEHDDTFAIVTAGTRTKAMGTKAQAASPENVRAAVQYLEQTHLIGALDLGAALDATTPFIDAAANPYLVHVGSGHSVLGERAPDKLASRIPGNAKYVGVGVGKNWSRQFMKAAALRSGGYFTQINPDESIQWRTFDLMATLNTPRLLDVRVEDAATEGKGGWKFLTFTDSLGQGEELCAVTRLPQGDPLPGSLVLTGTLDGKPYREVIRASDVTLGNTADNNAGYLPRMWAKLEVDRLLAEGSEANKEAITQLSKAMYVMSPYTSLLVLETEAMYAQYKVDRGRKDHWAMYAAPAKIKVVYEPNPTPIASNPTTMPANQKLSLEQALNTVLIRIPPRGLYWPNEQNHYRGSTVTVLQYYNAAPYALEDQHGAKWSFDLNGSRQLSELQQNFTWGADRFDFLPTPARYRRSGMEAVGSPVPLDEITKLRAASSSRMTVANGRALSTPMASMPHPVMLSVDSRARRWDIPELELVRKQFLQPGQQQQGGGRGDRGGPSALRGIQVRQDLSLFMQSGRDFDDVAFEFGGFRSNWDKFEDRKSESGRRTIGLSRSNSFTYQRPYFSGDWRVFSDLLQYAPGMNTSNADLQVILEEEVQTNTATGKIDDAARRLIDRARAAGWMTATISQGARRPGFDITFDGQGRYRYERTVSEGLGETVMNDGKTLLHLYAELGVGARRNVSRFHFEELAGVIPWFLPASADLARGCDVIAVDPHMVALVPIGAADRKDEKGAAIPFGRIELVFADDGRLAERRWVEMPTAKSVFRETYSAAGEVRAFGDDGKELPKAAINLALKPAAAPALTADVSKLVVLPLPYRQANHITLTRGINSNNPAAWSEDDALAMVGSYFNSSELSRIIGTRFFARGDRRIGFYTLILSSHHVRWDTPQNLGNGVSVTFNPMIEHSNLPLARFYVDQQRVAQQGQNVVDIAAGDINSKEFIPRLAAIRDGIFRLQRGENGPQDISRVIDRARLCQDPEFAWGLLVQAMNYGGGNTEYQRSIAELAKSLEDVPGFSYVARYEHARALTQITDGRAEAKRRFTELYNETLNAGVLPPIDSNFRYGMQANAADEWGALMRDAASTIRTKYGRVSAVYHAWQLYQLGDQALAEELLSLALADLSADERVPTIVTAVEYLYTTNQFARAAQVMEPLLRDPAWKDESYLWRVAADVAYQRGMLAQGLEYQERALDLEFARLPELVNLEVIRNDYSTALAQYLRLANAIATLRQDPPADLIARVIRTADRWRSIDPDKTAACQAAAQIFQALKVEDLAWDYMTTPLAEKSNEAQPWVNLAQMLRQQGDFALAGRAYTTAFDVEQTNAQVLWDHAMMLQQTQRFEEARKLFQKLADGTWQPRFTGLQNQARSYLQNR